jgi:3-deoxy-manno-octulosonate cytidylyltransferase (CMP-KDO synthetase)
LTVAAIIPARFAASRFPGKPLANKTGKYLVQHVYEAVSAAQRVDRVLIATDDERIATAVRSFGGQVAMTRSDHPTGTDRVAEAARELCGTGVSPVSLIINVQGDEPEMDPRSVDALVELMERRPEARMGSLACPFRSEADLSNPACVKVVLDKAGDALYFSRSLIPYPRDAGGTPADPSKWLLHQGIYAYRADFLQALTRWPPTELERIEQLEQLRVLYNGTRIAMAVVPRESTGIDTPEQYEAFVARYLARK